jgi:hypothetical protein
LDHMWMLPYFFEGSLHSWTISVRIRHLTKLFSFSSQVHIECGAMFLFPSFGKKRRSNQ